MPISTDRDIHSVLLEPIISPAAYVNTNGLHEKDLSFRGQDTQHSSHSLHPYVAAINPPLARELINAYVPQGGIILDPYCGGGGVLVETMLSDRNAIGFDVNPLAVLISKAKTTYLPEDLIVETADKILKQAEYTLNHSPNTNDIDEQLAFWFKEETLAGLCALKDALSLVTNPELLVLFKVILSGTVRDVMLTYRGEVRLRRLTGKDLDKFKPDVFKSFSNRISIAAQRIPSLPKSTGTIVGFGDVKNISCADNSVSAIVCSPPYADDKNGVSYLQFSKNMLRFIGLSSDDIKKAKTRFLGSLQLKNKLVVPPSNALQMSLDHVQQRSAIHFKEAVSFYQDYHSALGEMARVVSERVIIVIGNRVLSRTVFNNAHITVDLMKDYGVELEHYYSREIIKKRIPNLGVDGGGISTEHILVFRK